MWSLKLVGCQWSLKLVGASPARDNVMSMRVPAAKIFCFVDGRSLCAIDGSHPTRLPRLPQ